ncbi:cellulase family glycosylhydrolase [Bacillus velezensis]|nr:cellulase family glycosylhydrolase [Bacillus velezensis]
MKNKVKEAVETAKELGIYVIIDWHILNDGNPNQNKEKAKEFSRRCQVFTETRQTSFMKLRNEPNGENWKRDIKPYAEEVISVIAKMIQTTSSLSEPVHGARM